MDLKYVLYEKIDNIAKITLNRPEVGNALDLNLARDLFLAISEVKSDSSIKAVVVTGAGKVFSAGGDVNYLLDVVSELSPIQIRDFLIELGKPIMALRELKQPVLAAINGGAVGAGFDMLLHCDLRIAAEKAVMGPTWVRNGIIPVMGGLYLLSQFVGRTKATEMILRGQLVSGEEAKQIGLVNESVPQDRLEEESMNIARDIAQKAPLAVAIIKDGLQRCMDWNLQNELEHALYLQASCMKTEDFKRGLRAFLEKKAPVFEGD
jgi:2-(1,2-epoxy-1,2-dihydrophenyl)acetyl-CoA isomerase